jgi:glycosyltransferase involved in cell wall biosynthesis
VPETIEDGVTGFLLKHNTGDAVAAALTHLVDDPAARIKMGHASRVRYEKMFSSSRMTSATLRLYQELIRTSS